MVTPILKIGGVDVSEYFKGLTVSPTGPGTVGRGDLMLDKQAGGLTITNMMPVELYIPFNAAGAGVAARGRLFAGFVSNRATGTIGTTKLWQLACQDWNLILDGVKRDAAPAYEVNVSADDFAGQIQQVVDILQFNGTGTVNTSIDASTRVANLVTSTMPALVLPPGKKLRYYIQQICNSAVAIDPTINPRFFIGTSDTFGIGDVFGVPHLDIYDGNLTPSPSFTFDEDNIYGQFSRVLETSQIVQRLQSIWGPGSVATYEESASQVLYPNPYINHGETGNTGFWMSEPIADTESTNSTEAEAKLERIVKAKAYPRETISFATYSYVRVGDVVELSWDTEGLANVIKRVVGVTYTMDGLDLFVQVTLNARRLLLGEEGDEGIDAPPEEGDPVPPSPPGTPTSTYNRYDMALGLVRYGIAFTASTSGDVAGYFAYWDIGTEHGSKDLGSNTAGELILDPGVDVDIYVKAYDGNNNYSAPSGTLSDTTADIITSTLYNGDAEIQDPHDSTRADGWTPANNNGTTSRTNTTGSSGAWCWKFEWPSGASPPLQTGRLFAISDQHVYFINALAKASVSDAVGVNLVLSFYDENFDPLAWGGTTPVLTSLTTDWRRKNARKGIQPPTGARYVVVQQKPAGAARAVTWYVDDIQFYWQLPGEGVEDGAVIGPHFADDVTLTTQVITMTATSQISAGGGLVTIDDSGIKLLSDGTGNNNIDFYNNAITPVRGARIYGGGSTGSFELRIDADYNGAGTTSIDIVSHDKLLLGVTALAATIDMAAGWMAFDSGATSRPFTFSNGSLVASFGGLATNAVDGFIYIGSCAGTPTGTPAAQGGGVPLVMDSTNRLLYAYMGGAWRLLGPGAAPGVHASTHATGGTDVLRLDQVAVPTADVSLNSKKITNLATPTANSDGATLDFVVTTINLQDVKASVKLATTGNITLSGTQTIDGISAANNDRVGVIAQTAGAENGIWIVQAGAWFRAPDANTSAEVTTGMFFFVDQGTVNGGKGFRLSTTGAITLGTTALVFTQFTPSDATTSAKGVVELATDGENAASVVVQGNDTRINRRGAALPGSPTTGDEFFYTGTGKNVLVYYDGTRWLGPERDFPLGQTWDTGTPPFTVHDKIVYHAPLRASDSLYLTCFYASMVNTGTNDSSNYWTFELQKGDGTLLANMTSQSGYAGGFDAIVEDTTFSANPISGTAGLIFVIKKTGSPGPLIPSLGLTFHKVYT